MLCAGRCGDEGRAQQYPGPGHPSSSVPEQHCAHRAYRLEDNEWGCREWGKGDVFIKKGIKQFMANYVLEALVTGEE